MYYLRSLSTQLATTTNSVRNSPVSSLIILKILSLTDSIFSSIIISYFLKCFCFNPNYLLHWKSRIRLFAATMQRYRGYTKRNFHYNRTYITLPFRWALNVYFKNPGTFLNRGSYSQFGLRLARKPFLSVKICACRANKGLSPTRSLTSPACVTLCALEFFNHDYLAKLN